MMQHCDLHDCEIDCRGCPWCLIESLERQLAEARTEVERYNSGAVWETKVDGVPVSMWKEAYLPRIPLPIEYMNKKVRVIIVKLEV